MPVTEEHFVGFDPTLGPTRAPGCPYNKVGATIIWYEQWFFTGWTVKYISDTGIMYVIGYGTFDILGNLIAMDDIYGLGACGFGGNETCYFEQKCPTNDAWLKRARAACGSETKPQPGTVMLAPTMSFEIGVAA
jgi:hypothetical protein